MEKYNEIQLTKNKMDLNIRKMTNHPPYPDTGRKYDKCFVRLNAKVKRFYSERKFTQIQLYMIKTDLLTCHQDLVRGGC